MIISMLINLLVMHLVSKVKQPCDTCVHYSNQKCFYYKVLLKQFVVPLQDQIMEQDFANEKNALDVNISRNDTRFCGPNAKNYEKRCNK